MTRFVEIADNVFIGTKIDYILSKKDKNIIYVCATNNKEINNKQETIIKDNVIYLNLIDAQQTKYINKEAIDFFINYYKEHKDKTYYIFCDQGLSRSPTLSAILLLINRDKRVDSKNFNEFLYKFKQIYPQYCPNNGMLETLKQFYGEYHV